MTRQKSSEKSQSILFRALKVLPASDKPKIIAVVILQATLGFLDLLGVAAIGVLGALAVTGVQSQSPGNRVSEALNFLGISSFDFQSQVAFLGLGAAFIFVTRTIISIIVTRKIFNFLSLRGALISTNLISRLMSQSIIKVQERSTQETVYSLTTGVTAITLGVLGTAITLVSDGSLLVIMVVGLFIVDPTIALATILFFSMLGFSLYKLMNVKARELGRLNSKLSVESNEKITEVLDSYRESVVRNRRSYYAREIGRLRKQLALVLAELQFLPNVSKYVIESGMVVGAVILAGIQFGLQDARHAVATLSVFLAAGTRIAPAIMRVQQSLITLKSSIGSSVPTLSLIESLEGIPEAESVEDSLNTDHLGFIGEVSLTSVSLTYPGSSEKALSDLSLEIPDGLSVAIVGTSGAGKTSLVDVLLGVVPVNEGIVRISGLSPSEAIEKWPGAISYVPQDVSISNGTIRQNISLGYPAEFASDELVWAALEVAQLKTFVRGLPMGLETHVGERGTRLSGGQRQRLGIARAMFTKPKLLVLDEATSSLDGQTEADISDAIEKLQGSVTVILIAHRLSTVRNSSKIIYLSKGKILATGTFNEVRKSVPNFDQQAKLMGL
jgi:ABC-type multidrug transport system fused ATPase/permease subunit